MFLRYLSFLILLSLPCQAFALSEPKQVIESVLADMKQGSFHELLRRVHWSSAYQALDNVDRKQMGISSPEQLQQYFNQFFSEPEAFVRQKVRSRFSNLPEDRRALLEQQMQNSIATVRQKQTEVSEKMRRSFYEIGDVRQIGDDASVEVVARVDGLEQRKRIRLRRINGEWYLPSTDWISEHSQQEQIEVASR